MFIFRSGGCGACDCVIFRVFDCFAGGLFDEQSKSGSISEIIKNVFRYAVWRVNQQPRGRKFAYDIQSTPVDNSFETAKRGLRINGLNPSLKPQSITTVQ